MLGSEASFSCLINTETSTNTHTYTHSHFSLGCQSTKSLLKLTFEKKFSCCRSKKVKKKKKKEAKEGIIGTTGSRRWMHEELYSSD